MSRPVLHTTQHRPAHENHYRQVTKQTIAVGFPCFELAARIADVPQRSPVKQTIGDEGTLLEVAAVAQTQVEDQPLGLIVPQAPVDERPQSSHAPFSAPADEP